MMVIARLLVVTVLLAGCVSVGEPPDADAAGGALLAAACAAPCERVIDGGEAQAFEPHVAASPLDPDHIVATQSEITRDGDAASRWNVVYVSRDGGDTWTTSRLPGGVDEDPSHALFGVTETGDPVVAFLPDGTLVHVGLAFTYAHVPGSSAGALTGFSVYAARSTDGGETWPEVTLVYEGKGAGAAGPVPMMSGFGAADQGDKPWIAVGPDGALLLVWSNVRFPNAGPSPFDTLDLVFSTSSDGGRTWAEPRVISDGPAPHGGFPVVLADGAWVVAYVTFGGDWTLHVARSADQGATWDVQELGPTAPVNYPQLAVAGERLVLVTAVLDGDQAVPSAFVSTDGGATWTAPLALDAPQPRAPVPSVAADARGVAYVTYYHATGDALEVRAVALDGANVSAPVTLSAAPLPDDDPMQLGHYFGAAGLPEGAFAVWVGGERPATDLLGAHVGRA